MRVPNYRSMLLGFDARVVKGGDAHRGAMRRWAAEPATHWLPEIAAPLSVNTLTWPEVRPKNALGVKWFSFQGLAARLDEVREVLPLVSQFPRCDLIGITVCVPSAEPVSVREAFPETPALPATVEASWKLL